MKRTNILITSAGKRVTLVQLFQKELRAVYPESKVFTTDMRPEMAPACVVSDQAFFAPKFSEPDYMDRLLNIAISNNIGMIIPTLDTELELYSNYKESFAKQGIHIIVSSIEVIRMCRDKRLSNMFFKQHNIDIPVPVDPKNNSVYPIFAKPYDGSLSRDIYVIRSSFELTDSILENRKLMFMEYIDKSEFAEFTVDMYFGKDKEVKFIVPRERLEVRAGEINKGITRKNSIVTELKQRLSPMKGFCGVICVQLFYHRVNSSILGIEINPRFGGGFPLSYFAGANMVKALIDEYINETNISYSEEWKTNTLMLRYDADVIVEYANV